MKKLSINKKAKILGDLYDVIIERSNNPSTNSYVSLLLSKGKSPIQSKLLEETLEVLSASQEASREQIIHEAADMLFHLLVLLGYWQITPDDIYHELSSRWGRSGLIEKSERTNQ
jgi:phosphoribosyl-ATP pyrophosphohydrolase